MRPTRYGPKKPDGRKRGPGKPKPAEHGDSFGLTKKLTGNRRSRPAWAMDDLKLIEHITGGRFKRTLEIAQFYWQKNRSSTEIAEHFRMSRNSVKSILSRLARKKVVAV
jgi:hypothetical protein